MRRILPALLRPTMLVPPKAHAQAQIKHTGGFCCLLRGILVVPIHVSGTFCASWGVLAASGPRLSLKAALEAFGSAKQLAVGCPAAGRLPAQGRVATPRPIGRRKWNRHGLEAHCSRTWQAHWLRMWLKRRCKCLLGAVCQRGDQVPHFMVIKRRHVLPSGATVTVTTAGMPSALVPPNACVRACGGWRRAHAACCTGKAADRLVWLSPKHAVGSLVSFFCSAHSILEVAIKHLISPSPACPLALPKARVSISSAMHS